MEWLGLHLEEFGGGAVKCDKKSLMRSLKSWDQSHDTTQEGIWIAFWGTPYTLCDPGSTLVHSFLRQASPLGLPVIQRHLCEFVFQLYIFLFLVVESITSLAC